MTPARFRPAALAALLTAVVGAACASAGSAPLSEGVAVDTAAPTVASRTAQVAVRNQNTADVTVYVVTTDESYRIGSVTSYNQRLFTLPPRFLAPGLRPRIVVSPLAGTENYASQPLLFGAGDTIVVEVGSWIRQSSVRVVGS